MIEKHGMGGRVEVTDIAKTQVERANALSVTRRRVKISPARHYNPTVEGSDGSLLCIPRQKWT